MKGPLGLGAQAGDRYSSPHRCNGLPEAAASEPLADEGCKVFEKEIRGEGWISTGKERDSVAL